MTNGRFREFTSKGAIAAGVVLKYFAQQYPTL